MTSRFSTLIAEYFRYLVSISRKVNRCAPASFLTAIPLVVLNQVFFILSFMLPLKVIILIGTEGIPRYLRFLITQETRQQWIIYLCLAIVVIYLLYLATDWMLSRLGQRGGDAIRRRGNKATLFHAEEDFSKSVFLRVAQTWGTALMVIGGFTLGLLLEWRLVAVLLMAVLLQTLYLARAWNRYQLPEHTEDRELFIQNRPSTLQGMAGLNTFLAFGVLVALFLTDPEMNFIIGLVMFILTRQVMQRLVMTTNDGNFLLQQRERIEALVDPDSHVREKRKSQEVSFEMLLMPDRRERMFESVAAMGYPDLAGRKWEWCDCAGRNQALYVSRGTTEEPTEYRLKIVANRKDAGLARELLFYRSGSAEVLPMTADFVGAGTVFGRDFLILRSGPLRSVTGRELPELVRQVRFSLWQHTLDPELALRLGRSFSALDNRLNAELFARIYLGCNSKKEEEMVRTFLGKLEIMREMVQAVPKVLTNRNLGKANMLVSEKGQPVLMNWDGIALDAMGIDLKLADIRKAYEPQQLIEELTENDAIDTNINVHGLRLVVHLNNLEKIVAREAYREALTALPPIFQILEESDASILPGKQSGAA